MANESKYVKFLEIDNFPEETQKLLSDYICPLCMGVIYEPQTDLCGHLFCRECINTHKRISKYCPIYKDKILKIQDIIVVKNIINGKKLNCKHFPKCLWSDKVGQYKDHLTSDCLYEKIFCEKCRNYVIRKEYLFHVTECATGETIDENDNNNDSIQNVCIYNGCDCKFSDLNTHLIEAKLSHEKLFIKLFTEFKQSIEDRILNLEKNIKLRRKKVRENNSNTEEEMSANHNEEEQIIEEKQKEFDTKKIYGKNSKYSEKLSPKKKGKKTRKKKDLFLVENSGKNEDHDYYIDSNNPEELSNELSEMQNISKKLYSKQRKKRTEEESLMNVTEFSRGIKIIGNRVINRGSTVKHRFAFMNFYLNEISFKWSVEIKHIREWIGLGVCLKDEIITSGYKFEKTLLHSTFLISSNGYIWNCRNQSENGIEIKDLALKDGDLVKFYYDFENRILISKFNGNKIELTNIYSPQLNFLVPCVILLHENDEVEFNVIS